MEPLLVYVGLALVISIIVIKQDWLQKKITKGFNLNPVDRDKDGIVQEGTPFERPAS